MDTYNAGSVTHEWFTLHHRPPRPLIWVELSCPPWQHSYNMVKSDITVWVHIESWRTNIHTHTWYTETVKKYEMDGCMYSSESLNESFKGHQSKSNPWDQMTLVLSCLYEGTRQEQTWNYDPDLASVSIYFPACMHPQECIWTFQTKMHMINWKENRIWMIHFKSSIYF